MTEAVLSVRRAVARLDRVWIAILAIMALIAILAPDQARASFLFVGESFIEILPFLALSIAIAAYAKASGADALIARAFQGRLVMMIPAAAAIGALSPFCSCGVIPLVAALLGMGVPVPAVMAFWLASPLMDPSMFVLTLGALSLDFALFKTAAAIGIGLLGGFGTAFLLNAGLIGEPLRPGVGNGGCGGSTVRSPKPVVWRFWSEPDRRLKFAGDALFNTNFLGKWLVLAFILESLMVAYVPADLVASAVGGEGIGAVLVAAAVGVPAYLNGYAALPLIGGLIGQGMAPGAGMAFLLAGGVTCIPAAVAVYALARLPVFFAYLGFAALGAVVSGLVYGMVA